MLHNEKELIERITQGETELFAHIAEYYAQAVYVLIVRIVGNNEDAEELTQDVLLRVFENLPYFNFKSSFSTWLYRIAYNEALSHTRHHREKLLELDERRVAQVSDKELDDWESSEREEEIERLIGAIESLPSQDRALVTMVYYNDFSLKKCAEIIGQSEINVKVKLHRIRKRLYLLVKS